MTWRMSPSAVKMIASSPSEVLSTCHVPAYRVTCQDTHSVHVCVCVEEFISDPLSVSLLLFLSSLPPFSSGDCGFGSGAAASPRPCDR